MANVSPTLQKENRELIFDAFRRWGYLQADLDPLGDLQPADLPELNLRPFCRASPPLLLRHDRRGVHAHSRRRATPLDSGAHGSPELPSRISARILERLMRAESFEQVMQSRYLGTKRFSLEGVAALIPLLDAMLDSAGRARRRTKRPGHEPSRAPERDGAHRRPQAAEDIFARFEDVDPRSVLGGGDVKYHIGATGDLHARPAGKDLDIHLVSNPSHLEAVDPVAMGRARAKQARIGDDGPATKFCPFCHARRRGFRRPGHRGGDAESCRACDGYTVGGTIHIIVNNLIGFTAEPAGIALLALRLRPGQAPAHPHLPRERRRSRRGGARRPHRRWNIATTFGSDVVMDLIGYRRHGHSEVDDPTITQPLRYRKIEASAALGDLRAKQIGVDPATPSSQEIRSRIRGGAEESRQARPKSAPLRSCPPIGTLTRAAVTMPHYEVDTGLVARQNSREITRRL